jgi:hypothetical protein
MITPLLLSIFVYFHQTKIPRTENQFHQLIIEFKGEDTCNKKKVMI